MNISKVYYEELKSKCVGGKWESVRIGAEVDVDDNEIGLYENRGNLASESLLKVKRFVRENINKEMGYDTEEKQKALFKALEDIRKEVKNII